MSYGIASFFFMISLSTLINFFLYSTANPSPFATNSFFYTDTTVDLNLVVNRSIAIHVANRGTCALKLLIHRYE